MSLLALLANSETGSQNPTPVSGVANLATGYSDAIPSLDQCDGVTRVGANRSHARISDAIEHVENALGWRHTAGHYWAFLVDPGDYHEQVFVGSGHVVIGSDPNDPPFIHHECPTGWSPVNTNGGNHVLAGLHIRTDDFPERTGTGIYDGVHHRVTENDVSIIEKCTVGSIGSDLSQGSKTYLIEVSVLVAEGGLNMHGGIENQTPLTVAWVRSNLAGEVSYAAMNDTSSDELWVFDTTATRIRIGSGTAVRVHTPFGMPIASTSVDPAFLDQTNRSPILPVRGIVQSPY